MAPTLYKILLSLVCLGLLGGHARVSSAESPLSQQELEEWFYDDERLHPFEDQVNEGTLQFLTTPPEKRVPYSQNLLTITEQSLLDGWVQIEQCHEQLDPIHAVEVVYRYKQMRGLRITKAKRIGRARVDGQSVQLEDVQTGAELCIQAEARILYKQATGGWVLRNGPFQRRFLDGYFPFHVRLRVNFPSQLLRYVGSQPQATAGFKVVAKTDSVVFDAWFEGQLFLEVYFAVVT